MIRDQPRGADLLAEARHVLRESVLPMLTSEARYNVLMALRAMELAQHELRADPVLEKRLRERLSRFVKSGSAVQDQYGVLSKNIRDGFFDASEELHVFLLAITAFKLNEVDAAKVSKELQNILDQLRREK